MPFDPSLPAHGAPLESAVIRSQLQALFNLINSIATVTSAQIDAVNTLEPGAPAAVSVTVDGQTLWFAFEIPRGDKGDPGEQGPQGDAGAPGADGAPGEISLSQLNGAIAGTARNPAGIATLDVPFADPDAESLRQAYNTLLGALFRPPV